MNREDAKRNLKVGDAVRVVRKVDPCREGWYPPVMDRFIGREFALDRPVSPRGGGVHLDCGWWFPPEALEPALYGNEEDP